MTDIRTKLAAYAPAFVEVLEELGADWSRALAEVSRRVGDIEQLGSRVTELENRMAEGGLKDGQTLRARVGALEGFNRAEGLTSEADRLGRIEQRIEVLEAARKQPNTMPRYEQLTPTGTIHVEFDAVQLRELVLAAREAHLACQSQFMPATVATLARALQHFEAVK